MQKKRIIIISALCLTYASMVLSAGQMTTTRVGRYLVEKNGPSYVQTDPLAVTFSLTFPPSIHRIQSALNYLLANTGYQLVARPYRSNDIKQLLKQRLPLTDRQLGPMTVRQGLHVLAGPAYQLLIDPDHRQISFQLKARYKVIYQTSVPKQCTQPF